MSDGAVARGNQMVQERAAAGLKQALAVMEGVPRDTRELEHRRRPCDDHQRRSERPIPVRDFCQAAFLIPLGKLAETGASMICIESRTAGEFAVSADVVKAFKAMSKEEKIAFDGARPARRRGRPGSWRSSPRSSTRSS